MSELKLKSSEEVLEWLEESRRQDSETMKSVSEKSPAYFTYFGYVVFANLAIKYIKGESDD